MPGKDKLKLKELDAFLKQGGFRRAKKPKGALQRARSQRDARLAPRRSAPKTAKGDIQILKASGWDQPWLLHGFSTRTGGDSTAFGRRDLNLGIVDADSRRNVDKNRRGFLAALVPPGDRRPNAKGQRPMTALVCAKQIHSDRIHILRKPADAKRSYTGDGLITNVPGLLLSVRVADCVPVLLVDPKHHAVGAFHAGWRGTVRRIVEKGVGMMRMEFGSDPAKLRAAIGPCIHFCCYAVGDEVVDKFHSQFPYAKELFHEVFDDDPVKKKYPLLFLTARAPGHSDLGPQTHLDLVEANRRQLLAAGLKAKNIWASDLCTSCRTDLLFSHRREDGFTGRMMGVVGVLTKS